MADEAVLKIVVQDAAGRQGPPTGAVPTFGESAGSIPDYTNAHFDHAEFTGTVGLGDDKGIFSKAFDYLAGKLGHTLEHVFDSAVIAPAMARLVDPIVNAAVVAVHEGVKPTIDVLSDKLVGPVVDALAGKEHHGPQLPGEEHPVSGGLADILGGLGDEVAGGVKAALSGDLTGTTDAATNLAVTAAQGTTNAVMAVKGSIDTLVDVVKGWYQSFKETVQHERPDKETKAAVEPIGVPKTAPITPPQAIPLPEVKAAPPQAIPIPKAKPQQNEPTFGGGLADEIANNVGMGWKSVGARAVNMTGSAIGSIGKRGLGLIGDVAEWAIPRAAGLAEKGLYAAAGVGGRAAPSLVSGGAGVVARAARIYGKTFKAAPVATGVGTAAGIAGAIMIADQLIKDVVKGSGNVVGGLSKWAASGPDVAGNIKTFGAAVSSVGDKIPFVGFAFTILGEKVKLAGELIGMLNETSQRYGQYNATIGRAQAIAEVRQVQGDYARAQKLGPDLAKFIQAQSDLQQKAEEIKIKLLTAIIPAVTDTLRLLESTMPIIEKIADDVAITLKAIQAIANKILMIQEKKDERPMNDPTTMLFDKGMGGIFSDQQSSADEQYKYVPNL